MRIAGVAPIYTVHSIIAGGSICGIGIRSQKPEKGIAEEHAEKGKKQAAEDRAVKSKGRAAVYGVVIFSAQSPAHHTGAAHAKKIVDCVEGKKNGRSQRNSRIFNRVVQHADKIGIR